MSIRKPPGRPDLLQYKKQAKELLKSWRSGDATALARLREHHPLGRRIPAPTFQLSDAQWVLAREHGFESWRSFTDHIRNAAGVSSDASSSEALSVVQLQVPTPREVNLGVFLRRDLRMVTATEAEPLRLWDRTSGALLREYGSYGNHAWAIHIADDNRTMFVGCRDGAVRVVDLDRDAIAHVLTGHRDLVRCVDVSAGSTMAISGGMRDRELRVWDVESERCRHVLAGHRDGIYSVALDGTARRALSGSRDTSVRLWDLEAGKCTAILEGHRYHVHDLAWSADGQRALSCSQDIRLWDVAAARSVRAFEGHTETIRSVAWSPDERLAVSAAHDRTVRVWNVETGQCLHVFEGHSTGVIRAVWIAAGRIGSCDWNGEVRIWPF